MTGYNQRVLEKSLQIYFGYGEFRPQQEDAVAAAMESRDVLVVMPTGAGKSLCFQLPAALSEGVTLVVSPLIALMRDQVDALNRRPEFAKIGCACLTSLQSPEEQYDLLRKMRQGHLKLVYVAPERFRSGVFMEALKSVKIARFVVDEAHCISEWGHDFRPDYLSLREVVETLGNPPLLAATATATKRVQQSIVANLGMRDPLVLVGGFDRPNLHFSVHRCKSDSEREDKLTRALPKLSAMGGSGLIYVATRKQCEQVFELAGDALAKVGQKAGMYHAGLDADIRNQMQREWLDGERQVLVATNAFGMGIDKPDVRFVVHCACPDSLESYYQEAGRAGRDGRKSRCVILYHFADRRTREWFIDNEAMTVGDVERAFGQIRRHADTENTAKLPKSWGMALDWSDMKGRLALGELERADLIKRVAQTGDAIVLTLARPDFPPDSRRQIAADLAKQRAERLRRLDEIVDYCKTPHCRRRTILDYFGDRQEPAPTSFCCDNCDAPPAQSASSVSGKNLPSVPMPAAINPGDIYSVLQGLDALRPAVGKARLNKLLRGSGSLGDKAPTLSNPLNGVFRGSTVAVVDKFLAALFAEGLMHQGDEDAYFVCTVTAEGRAAWQDHLPVNASVPRGCGALSGSEIGDGGSDDVLTELKHWRTAQASKESLPPYCVFNDKTLIEIARARPQSTDDLLEVSGVGPSKLEKYGGDVLKITGER
jgi:ATP-dependent DNA helicase RecQ